MPYTPAWAEKITGVPRDQIIAVAREFARNAEKTNGRSMVIIGAGMNHWYHMDMNYRGIINMLVMCGCVGQSRRRLGALCRPGKAAAADRLDCRSPSRSTGCRPPRQMNGTSFFYAHTDQWRYEKLDVSRTAVADCADPAPVGGSMIDYNVRAERMGWLPSAPQLETNPLEVSKRRRGRRHGGQGLRRARR